MVSRKLFRDEALAFQQDRLLGEVSLANPIDYAALTALAVCVALLVLVYGYVGEYTRKAHVPGYLVPNRGLIKIYAPETGTLVKKQVQEGQVLQQGDPLFVVSTERSSSTTREARAAAIAQLQQRRDSLKQELEKQVRIDAIETQNLRERLHGKEAGLTQLSAELATQRDKLSSAEVAADRYRRLGEQKFVPELQVREKLDNLLDEKGRLQALQRQRLDLETEIHSLRHDASANELKYRNQRAAIERNISSLEQELTEYESRREIVIRAPSAGKATAILGEPGQTVTAERPLVSIVPFDARLIAHLLVPSRAIGFIGPGQTVAVRYQAFPYQRFGSQRGAITEISKTLITPQDGTDLPIKLEESVYRVTARLNSQTVRAYGNAVPLQVGMLLDADIWLDHRRLFEWLLEPLYSITGRM